jgi:hypothetical protein
LRLSEHWHGRGLAREAAEASLQYGFGVLSFDQGFSYTTPLNTASWGLLERLGMTFVCEFNHPKLHEGHSLRCHVLYELRRDNYQGASHPVWQTDWTPVFPLMGSKADYYYMKHARPRRRPTWSEISAMRCLVQPVGENDRLPVPSQARWQQCINGVVACCRI